MRNSVYAQAHLNTGENASYHEIMKIAEMANSEDPISKRTKAIAEGHIAARQDLRPQTIGGITLGKPHRGQ